MLVYLFFFFSDHFTGVGGSSVRERDEPELIKNGK